MEIVCSQVSNPLLEGINKGHEREQDKDKDVY
jgi:hypothetical protein